MVAMWRVLDRVFYFISGEILLQDRPNGGTAILVRALWVTVFIYVAAVVWLGFLRTGLGPRVDGVELRAVLADTLPWAGAIFAAAYAALYSRFSSQWTYLAGVYYQYMSTRAQAPIDGNAERAGIYEAWKAALVEDAEDLHLATKKMYSTLLLELLTDEGVRRTFADTAAGGQPRLDRLIGKLERAAETTLQTVAQGQDARKAFREARRELLAGEADDPIDLHGKTEGPERS
jgi:hypothetical protein